MRLKIFVDYDTRKLNRETRIHFLALNAHSYRVYYNADARGSFNHISKNAVVRPVSFLTVIMEGSNRAYFTHLFGHAPPSQHKLDVKPLYVFGYSSDYYLTSC